MAWVSPVNLQHFFGTPFPKNTSERLLLLVAFSVTNSNVYHSKLHFLSMIIQTVNGLGMSLAKQYFDN